MNKFLLSAILRPKDVCRYLGISRTALHWLHKRDRSFPRKIMFTPRCVGWRKESLDAWLDKKEAGGC